MARKASGIICQACGVEAPTAYVVFHQNIGALVMRFHRSIKGMLCKNCVHKKFWSMTMVTLGIGWLGMISVIIAPIFILLNLVNYLRVIAMKAVPAGAAPPVLTADASQRIVPYRGELVSRINQGEQVADVVRDIGPRAGVTPGQVLKFLIAISPNQPVQRPTYAFPVQQAPIPVQAIPLPPPPPPPAPSDATAPI